LSLIRTKGEGDVEKKKTFAQEVITKNLRGGCSTRGRGELGHFKD